MQQQDFSLVLFVCTSVDRALDKQLVIPYGEARRDFCWAQQAATCSFCARLLPPPHGQCGAGAVLSVTEIRFTSYCNQGKSSLCSQLSGFQLEECRLSEATPAYPPCLGAGTPPGREDLSKGAGQARSLWLDPERSPRSSGKFGGDNRARTRLGCQHVGQYQAW